MMITKLALAPFVGIDRLSKILVISPVPGKFESYFLFIYVEDGGELS